MADPIINRDDLTTIGIGVALSFLIMGLFFLTGCASRAELRQEELVRHLDAQNAAAANDFARLELDELRQEVHAIETKGKVALLRLQVLERGKRARKRDLSFEEMADVAACETSKKLCREGKVPAEIFPAECNDTPCAQPRGSK